MLCAKTKDEITALMRQISFENDLMQVLALDRPGPRTEFPLTDDPINFAVLHQDGLSHRWGVTVNPKGDVYIYNRDIKHGEKVSLHARGRQHVTMPPTTSNQVRVDDRFGPVWTEPRIDQDGIVATFSIVVPPWGYKNSQPRLRRRKNEALIIGHRGKLTVIGFFITSAETNLEIAVPHFQLGKLTLGTGKVLQVVTWREEQGNLRESLLDGLRRIPCPLPRVDDLWVNFQGFRQPNSAYMVAVPVSVTERPAKDVA